jgi:alanine racemase
MVKSPSTIFLSKSALQNNIDFIKSQLGEHVAISSVIKGNAYGHGVRQFVKLAEGCGIRHFSVFSADEALEVMQVRENGSEIMIMGALDNDDLEWVISNDIHFFVFELDRLTQAIVTAQRLNKKARIHLEVETGLNRTGFDQKGILKVINYLNLHDDHFVLEGVCTHFAGAESVANHYRVKKQHKTFNKLYKILISKGLTPKIRHTACSAAAITYPKTQMDMVRIGILQYGFWPSRETFIEFLGRMKNADKNDPLKRVISWRSTIMSTKSVQIGEFIGYGTSYLAQQDMRIATVPVGYAQGYSRSLSNLGRVLVKQTRAGVIGVVNMNMLILDISETDAEKGDEVILIGGDNEVEISVASFGELSNQLNYELLTRLPDRIPRIIKE